MKKFLLGLLPFACVAITSCGGGETKDVRTYSSPAFNLITSLNGDEAPTVTQSVYNITVDAIASTLTLSSPSLTLPTGPVSFTTSPMTTQIGFAYVNNNRLSYAYIFKAQEAGSASLDINSVNGYYTQAVYFPNNEFGNDRTALPGYSWYFPDNTYFYLYTQYKIGNSWYVRTFWPDATYHGQTLTTYPGASEPYKTEDITYRIIMQAKDGALTGKADLIIYDPVFAPTMPIKLGTMRVKGLDITFTNNGYTLTGKDILPELIEGGEWQVYENERFIFKEINGSVGTDLTGLSLTYNVGGVFGGNFTGSSIVKAQ